MRKGFGLLLCAALGLAAGGATCFDRTSNEKRVAALRQFTSAQQLRTYFAEQAIARRSSSYGRIGGPVPFFMAPMSPVAEATGGGAGADDANSTGGDSYSSTNVQEPGVDEADVARTDGRYIYLLKNDSLRIVSARPADALEQLSKVDVPTYADSLYVRGERVIVVSHQFWVYYFGDGGIVPVVETAASTEPGSGGGGTASSGDAAPSAPADATDTVDSTDGIQSKPPTNLTIVTVINAADPRNPTVEATLTLEGDLITSRMIDNKLHVILTLLPNLPVEPTTLNIRNMSVEDWIPDYEITGADGRVVAAGDAVDWRNCYYPANADGYGTTQIITIDVDNPTAIFDSTAIVADAGTIYASTNALYVTDTEYDTEGYWRPNTVVHKLALTDEGTEYEASGLVPGHLLNQYSLGEYGGHLRVATTVRDGDVFNGSESNAVYVLGAGAEAGKMDVVGRIENIAPGEQIYSARFIGARGYLVTFRRVDPLFTLDLADPTAPQVVGELKVPGYSEYIHPLGDTHLLTIGRDVDDSGSFPTVGGVQLSLFDVSDFANPRLVDSAIIGSSGTYSEAEYNPKAFNYYAEKGVLGIPIITWGGLVGADAGVRSTTSRGVVIYRVSTDTGFTSLGQIATSGPAGSDDTGQWDVYIRAMFIGDDAYAVTNNEVESAAIETPGTAVGSLALPE